jgi:hypothetical protein
MTEVSFGRVLNELGTLAGLPLGEDGAAVFSGGEEGRFCARLNGALRWLWLGALGRFALPEMMRDELVTLETDGLLPAGALEGAVGFFSVWSPALDPREALPGHRLRGLRAVAGVQGGGVRVRDGVPGEVVLLFARRPLPVWTVRCLTPNDALRAGDVRRCGDEVYRALVDDPAGDVTDASFWEPARLPVGLMEVVIRRANYERLRGDVQLTVASGPEGAEADERLEMLRISAEETPGDQPWLYNHYR